MLHTPSRYALARKAVRSFPRTEYAPRSAINSHRRKWIAAVTSLGDSWRGIAVRLPTLNRHDKGTAPIFATTQRSPA